MTLKQKTIRTIAILVGIVVLVFCVTCFFTTNDSIVIVNDLRKEEIALGKKLFNDKRLSRDITISCTSCHNPNLAFTDGKVKSIGIGGKLALRNAPSLFNISDAPYFMQDGGVPTLEMQVIVPIQDVNEMGFTMKELIERLNSIPEYNQAAKRIYNRKIDAWVITRSLARFEETLKSKNSKFDWYLRDSVSHELSKSELRGYNLFKNLDCIKCHALPNLTNYEFKTNHLTELSENDYGRFRITGAELDKGKFKTPSLRNIVLTGPYMHDGSYKSLKSVIVAYLTTYNSVINTDIRVSKNGVEDIISFLQTLTDTSNVDSKEY